MILEALIEYRLCLCVRRGGGDFVLEGYVHVVKFMGGLCPCCKIHGGIMSMLQNSWGDYVHVYKF